MREDYCAACQKLLTYCIVDSEKDDPSPMQANQQSWLARLETRSLRPRIADIPTSDLSRGLLLRVFRVRARWRLLILAVALLSAIAGLTGPYFQKLFVDSILATEAPTTGELALWVTLAFLSLLATQVFGAVCRLLCSREAAILHRWLARAMYEHVLRLSQSSRRSQTVGEFVNSYAQDISAAVMLVDELLPVFLLSIIPIIVAPIAVGAYFSTPALPLVLVSLASLSVLMYLALRQSGFFSAFKKLASDRLAVVNEWLQNIRIIRILGWTEIFEEKIFSTRRLETDNRLQMVTNGSAMNALAQVVPSFISITGIASIVFAQGEVSPGEVFGLLWVLSIFLTRPIRSLPFNVVVFLDGRTSCQRLERLFALPRENLEGRKVTMEGAAIGDDALRVEGLNLTIHGISLLEDISFLIRQGEFVAVIGEVGAGKSLLLDSLLREAPAEFRRYEIEGQDALSMNLDSLRAAYAFVPQEGFVMSSSLRDNVAFEYETPDLLDSEVLSSLRLSSFDIEGSLDTEIGERGVNLSGGQRQRVNLGRAHFSRRPVVLLDDCLSAVDVDTERRLLDELIDGAWAQKARLLVTHRLSVLPRVDRILFMQKGRIVLEGSYDDLMRTSAEFRHFTSSLEEAP